MKIITILNNYNNLLNQINKINFRKYYIYDLTFNKNNISIYILENFNCEEDFITFESLKDPYISIGDNLCVSCETIENIQNKDKLNFNKDPYYKIFNEYVDKEKKELLNNQLKYKCKLNLKNEVKIKNKIKTNWSGFKILENPSKKEKIKLLTLIENNSNICKNKISNVFITKSILKANIILYSYDNKIRSFISSYKKKDKTNEIHLDIICSNESGDGYKLFNKFLEFIKQKGITKITLETIKDNSGDLISNYKRWSFKLTFKDCQTECNMYFKILI
jgi:hypothetical protein